MRNTVVVGVLCLFASAAVAGSGKFEPLNVKPGTWQVTETYSATGLPVGMPAGHTIQYKSCVTSKELNTNPFSDPEEKCTWTVLNSTGSDMEVKGTSCSLGEGLRANVHLKLHVVDSEHVNGSGDWTANFNGQPMSGKASGTGKWISATCSAR